MSAEQSEEEALVRAFVIRPKQARLVELLSDPRRRRKATASLAHFRALDARYLLTPPPDAQTSEDLAASLRERGAPDTCHVISDNVELDGKRLPLDFALRQIVGYGYGTFLSCIPGVLAYFEGEGPGDRHILLRPASRR